MTLEPGRVGSEHVDVCPQCMGVWFDRGEAKLLKTAEELKQLIASARYATGRCAANGHPLPRLPSAVCGKCKAPGACCPSCGGRLAMIAVRGKIIDVCDRCEGVWLDGGELSALIGGSAVPLAKGEVANARQAPPPPSKRRLGFSCTHCETAISLYGSWLLDGNLYCENCRPQGASKSAAPVDTTAIDEFDFKKLLIPGPSRVDWNDDLFDDPFDSF